MTELFQEVNETPELPETSVEVIERIDDYFAEPDLSKYFTLAQVAERHGQTREQVRGKVKKGIDRGEIEFVMNYKNQNYYKFVGKDVG